MTKIPVVVAAHGLVDVVLAAVRTGARRAVRHEDPGRASCLVEIKTKKYQASHIIVESKIPSGTFFVFSKNPT